MPDTPVYSDARMNVLATALAANHVERRILMPCHRKEFTSSVLSVLMKMSSEYERKLRAMQQDLDTSASMLRVFTDRNAKMLARIAELEQTIAEIPAEAWPDMEAEHVHV